MSTLSDAVRERLASLEKNGRITPEDVIEDAKNPDSPLHSQFEWDQGKAAHAHWVETARKLIRGVRLVRHVESRLVSSVAYVRDPTCAANQQGYRSVVSVKTERQLAEEVFREEVRRLVALTRRVSELATMLGMKEDLDIDSLLDRTETIAERVQSQPSPA
jgi:hypothetical protein